MFDALAAPEPPEPPARLYSLYGFRLRSCLPLPYPEWGGPGRPDIDIYPASASWFVEAVGPALSSPSWYYHIPLSDGSTYLRWSDLFEFLVSADGRRIACRPLVEGCSEAFHTYLLGQVLSFALVKQGVEPLHATTVVAHGNAVGLLGFSGDGKSTLAAAFLAAGYRILTDDLLVTRPSGSGYQGYPGPPRIKLFPEIARTLLGETAAGPPMNSLTPKMILPLQNGQYCSVPAPLRGFYVLRHPEPSAASPHIRIRSLSRRNAYLALSRHCFNRRVQDRERLKRQFLAAADLAACLPVKLLSYPRDLALLSAVSNAILADLPH